MNNPLTNDKFNRFEATRGRSPRFRAFVIFLLLLVSVFIVYRISTKKTLITDAKNETAPTPMNVVVPGK